MKFVRVFSSMTLIRPFYTFCAAALGLVLSLMPWQAFAGESCHHECRAGSACAEPKDLARVCRDAPEFAGEPELRAYLQTLGLVGQTLSQATSALERLDFSCGHPAGSPGTEWQCQRSVSVPRCMKQVQYVVMQLADPEAPNLTGPGATAQGAAKPPPRAYRSGERQLYEAMRIERASGLLAATGDDLCKKNSLALAWESAELRLAGIQMSTKRRARR